ncbi:MAG: nucleotidyltransferase domain-containing protein [Thermomicrobiales bacterium]|nr:nucleotidyltransferase domain-containing protein [Thermomicrobiales bacterium]
MFTVEQRDLIRDELIALAQSDTSIVGAALVGSSATNLQDDFSDIDLALQLASGADESLVVKRWTHHISTTYGLAHHLDVFTGSTRYRVFLLPESLQIDISFWANDVFAAKGDRFRLLFGTPSESSSAVPPSPDRLIGMAWLYALHVRSSIARNEPWHALTLLDDLRDHLLMLACIRHGLNAHELRGVDDLPVDILTRFADARTRSLETPELRRSLRSHAELLLDEVAMIDRDLAVALTAPIYAIKDYPS